MTEQEQQLVRATVLKATMLGMDEGISVAAKMVRAAAEHDQLLALLQTRPRDALHDIAAAIENTIANKPPSAGVVS